MRSRAVLEVVGLGGSGRMRKVFVKAAALAEAVSQFQNFVANLTLMSDRDSTLITTIKQGRTKWLAKRRG